QRGGMVPRARQASRLRQPAEAAASASRHAARLPQDPQERPPGRMDAAAWCDRGGRSRPSRTAHDDGLISRKTMPQPYDVLIAGGGLAGLCLARQLAREAPSRRVFLAERRAHPVPEAAFKV